MRVQDARFQQLLVNYQNTVLRAAQEVEDALTGFLKAQEATVFDAKLRKCCPAVGGDSLGAISGRRRGLSARVRYATRLIAGGK